MGNGTEDGFLGCLLGLAIGDALGMPVAGQTGSEIVERVGRVEEYLPRTLADGTEIDAGEFTDETEVSLCIVESMTANGGLFDPDNVGARLLYLVNGESRRWLRPETIDALERADKSLDFRVPLDEDGPATGDVATRGVPIGLIHSVGTFHEDELRSDAEAAARLTHGSPAAIAAVIAVAFTIQLAARREVPRGDWLGATRAFLGVGELFDSLHLLTTGRPPFEGAGLAATESVPAAILAAIKGSSFDETVFAVVNAGGATDSIAAIVGALSGAHGGVSAIPQRLIDGLGGRIYVSLAAPWFYRAAQRRAGRIIDMRFDGYGPTDPPTRPMLPPRR